MVKRILDSNKLDKIPTVFYMQRLIIEQIRYMLSIPTKTSICCKTRLQNATKNKRLGMNRQIVANTYKWQHPEKIG